MCSLLLLAFLPLLCVALGWFLAKVLGSAGDEQQD